MGANPLNKAIEPHSLVIGGIEIETIGPNPRSYDTHVRFVDLYHLDRQERIRIRLTDHDPLFSMLLPAGRYQLSRLQIHEGPFMGEANLHSTFSVPAERVIFLGTWQFSVDTPRTQRMVKMDISEKHPSLRHILNSHAAFREQPIDVVLPDPPVDSFRLFSVAPYPKARYFYRN